MSRPIISSRFAKLFRGDCFFAFLKRPFTFEDVTTIEIAIFFCLSGFMFDAIKAILFSEWVPRRKLGLLLFAIYALCNLAVPVLAALLRRIRVKSTAASAALGLAVVSSGFFNWLVLKSTIDENALTPLVYHGMFGVFAGALSLLRTRLRETRFSWTAATSNWGLRDVLEKRLRHYTVLCVLADIAALFAVGFSIVILTNSKLRSIGWVPTDPDFNATAIQFSFGLAICLWCAHKWGITQITRVQKWIDARFASETAAVFARIDCFISYSGNDEGFAQRLHAGLKAAGIRCWFAPEDLRPGDVLRVVIDDAIRVSEKLLLVLSAHSIQSAWVGKEVETAMEKEGQQKRTMLFPIRLDDAVMEIKTGWPADIRRTRHIGDFRNWKDTNAYTEAFGRLLRDLKDSEGEGLQAAAVRERYDSLVSPANAGHVSSD